MKEVLNKLLKATDSKRSSRFHDGDNVFMGWRNLLFLPLVATQWLMIKLFGKRLECLEPGKISNKAKTAVQNYTRISPGP